MLKDARSVIATDDPLLITDFAIEASRRMTAAKAGLDLAKAWLREEAHKETTSGTVEFEGALGTAQVEILLPKFQVKKGVKLLDCLDALPSGLVSRLFVRRTVVDFVDDFERRLSLLSTDQQMAIRNLVEKGGAQTPRVTLPQ